MIFDPRMSTKIMKELRCADVLGPQDVNKNNEKPKVC